MNKGLIFLLAAFPISALAQSQVTLYGTVELGVFGSKIIHGNERKLINRADDTGSLLGVSGTEALGGGNNVIWQIEGDISGDGTSINGGDGANKLASSDTFIGLEGAWGTLRLGNLSDYMNDEMATMDPWIYSDETVSGLGIMTRFDGSYGNSIRYDAPSFAGFNFNVLYSADEERENGNNAFVWSLGVGYEHEALFFKSGFMQFEEQNGSGDKNGNYWRIEAGYEEDLSLIFAYQQSRQYGAAATADTNSVWGRGTGDYGDFLGGSNIAFGDDDKLKTQEAAITIGYNFGAFSPRFSFAWGDDAKMNGEKLVDSGYQQYIIGADYTLSKRTLVYAAFGYVESE